MNKFLTTKEKELALDGKRYKIISASIDKRRVEGEEIPHELEIDLNHAWMKTMEEIKGHQNNERL